MLLMYFVLRLLSAIGNAGQWVPPVPKRHERAAISALEKIPIEKVDQQVWPSDVGSSKMIPRSAFDLKELVKIFNIAYSSNESQSLNHYELPLAESVKRDIRHVKMDNVDAESQKGEFSSPPLATNNTQNAEGHKIITSIPAEDGKPLYANGTVFNELVTEVRYVSDALVNTIILFPYTLEKQLETLCSRDLEFDKTEHVEIIIAFIICLVCLCLLLYIFHKILLTLRKKRGSFDCEKEKNSFTV